MNRVLITGATGFIGQHACRGLIRAGHQVHALVRSTSNIELIESLGISFEVVNSQDIDAAVENANCDTIVHCANSYGRDQSCITEVLDVNTAYPLRLIEAGSKTDLETFIYLDTCFTLSYPYLRAYTLSKKQTVQWGQLTDPTGNLRFLNLQIQHPFGPGDRAGKFVPWLINKCLEGRKIELTDGSQRKDFVFVEDVADAIVALAGQSSKLAAGFHEFECGRGESLSVREFVEIVHEATHSSAELMFGALPMRSNEIMNSYADTTALTKLGWTPTHTVQDGIRKTITASD